MCAPMCARAHRDQKKMSNPQCWSYRESRDTQCGSRPPRRGFRSPVLELQGVVWLPVWVLSAEHEELLSYLPASFLSFFSNQLSEFVASIQICSNHFFFFLQVRDVIRRLLREVSSYPSTTYGLLFLVCVSGRLAYCPLHLSVLIKTVCTRVNGKALEVEGDWNSSDSSTSEHAIEHCWALESVRMSKSYLHPVWVSTKQRNRAKRVRRWTFSSGSETTYLLPGQQNSRLFCS